MSHANKAPKERKRENKTGFSLVKWKQCGCEIAKERKSEREGKRDFRQRKRESGCGWSSVSDRMLLIDWVID